MESDRKDLEASLKDVKAELAREKKKCESLADELKNEQVGE